MGVATLAIQTFRDSLTYAERGFHASLSCDATHRSDL